MSAVLDTHAAIWYFHRSSELSSTALKSIRRSIDGGRPVYISAISIVETIYLVERGRLPWEALQRLEAGVKVPPPAYLYSRWMRTWLRRSTESLGLLFLTCPTESSRPRHFTLACPSLHATSESDRQG